MLIHAQYAAVKQENEQKREHKMSKERKKQA
jgi:hypothetical protein